MRLLISLVLTLGLAGCASTQEEPVSPFQEFIDSGIKEAPTLEHNDEVYEWDETKSFALNVTMIAGGHDSLSDAELPEDAQREVTSGGRLAGFLVDAWAGTLTQAIAFDSLTRQRRDSYRFDPYAIVFVDADVYNNELKGSEDGGFNHVFGIIKDELTESIRSNYNDNSVAALRWNKASSMNWEPRFNLRWNPDTDFVVTFDGAACEESTEKNALNMRDGDSGRFSEPFTMEGIAPWEDCNIYGEVNPLGYTVLNGEREVYAFKVTLSNNYFTPKFAESTSLTWVISTYWKDGFHTIRAPFPFVTYDKKGWLFTKSNDTIEVK